MAVLRLESAAPIVGKLKRRYTRQDVLWAVGVLLTVVLLVPAFAHAVEVWSTDEEFSYGFLIPPVTCVLLWWRRKAIRRSMGEGSNVGLLFAAASLCTYLFAFWININALAGYAVVPLLWGMAVYLWGWRTGRDLAFPLGFLVFGLGVFRGLLHTVGFQLQEITARGSHIMSSGLGLAVVRDGLILRGDDYEFLVAQACSGMSSLLSLLALASLFIYVANGSLIGRLLVLGSVAPIVLLANTTRVSLVLFVADWFGQETAIGFFHGASSLVLFGVAFGGLLIVSRLFGCKLPSFA